MTLSQIPAELLGPVAGVENQNDLGPVFLSQCANDLCGWGVGPATWTEVWAAMDEHENVCGGGTMIYRKSGEP